jgi:hypothetical protein
MLFKLLLVSDSGEDKNRERLEYLESELARERNVLIKHKIIKKLSQAACVSRAVKVKRSRASVQLKKRCKINTKLFCIKDCLKCKN